MNTHLDVLNLLLSNERIRLAEAKTDGERALRSVWVKQLEREVEGEIKFAGDISDEDLLAELGL